MTNFYVILLNTRKERLPSVDKLKEVVGAAKSWAQLNPESWIVASNLSAKDWYGRIRATMHPDDTILVMKLDKSDYKGFLSKLIVDWLTQDHSQKAGL